MKTLGSLIVALAVHCSLVGASKKIYGVNLGSWLVTEPWMLPAEWQAMGGQTCDDCSTCIATEFAFAKAYPTTVDKTFAQHWDTWFTQDHIRQLKAYGINTVRIPLGYWIVEDLVDRKTEYYPRGGLNYLIRGLEWLKDAGIQVILDHHALPGAQAVQQMFAGQCTPTPQFYTDYNYGRALTWTAVVTALTHVHPAFASVFALQAVNEPIMDANQTPGYGVFQVNFVQTVRAVESVLGVGAYGALSEDPVPEAVSSYVGSFGKGLADAFGGLSSTFKFWKRHSPAFDLSPTLLARMTLRAMDLKGTSKAASKRKAQQRNEGGLGAAAGENQAVAQALQNALPILKRMAGPLGIPELEDVTRTHGLGAPLTTNFMDVNWQNNNPPNPAQAQRGAQAYDNHLYYLYGGVADPNPTAYLQSICNLQRVQDDAKLGNSPLWFGEWALGTNFNANDSFTRDWADAQKMAYSKGAGWIFWNFRVEQSTAAGDLGRTWSYLEGVKRGYLTKDPTAYFNPHVCDPYTNP